MSNPFSDSGSAWGGSAWGGSASNNNHNRYNSSPTYGTSSNDQGSVFQKSAATQPAFQQPEAKSAREIELDNREAMLRVREAKLASREKEVGDYHPPNWPPFRPMVYHDIANDIPQEGQWLVKRVYAAWLPFSLLVTKADAAGGTFGVSIAMLVIGTPVSFSFWYKPLYDGVKLNRGLNFVFFFINYFIHLGVMGIMAVGIAGWGGAGVIYTLGQFGSNIGSAILCMISSAFLIFQVMYGLWQIKAVQGFWRGKGFTADQARNQAVQDVANSKIGQEAGKEVGKQAVKQAVANVRS
ncbi:scamp family-domain-containing protein [Entophlyctis helioformis]|nr:scamp family-domain-containing protein [Entophlyctis helioformis]